MPYTQKEILARLQDMAEPEYARFSASLIPDPPPILGVRLPRLRALAKELAKVLPREPALWQALEGPYLEQAMLHGMLLGAARLPDEERKERLEKFLPRVTNWSICDSTAISCKWMSKAPDIWLPWLTALARRDEEFPARFGIVCLLDHFTATPEGRRTTLDACTATSCPALYTRLGVAWAISIIAVKEPELGFTYLERDTLDDFTHNKAIQKICESLRSSPEYRARVRTLQRKAENGRKGR